MCVDVEVRVFAPAAVFAEFPAVIAPQDDNCVVFEVQAFDFVEHAPDLRVHIRDTRAVAVDQCARQVLGYRSLPGHSEVAAKFSEFGQGIFSDVFRCAGIQGEWQCFPDHKRPSGALGR